MKSKLTLLILSVILLPLPEPTFAVFQSTESIQFSDPSSLPSDNELTKFRASLQQIDRRVAEVETTTSDLSRRVASLEQQAESRVSAMAPAPAIDLDELASKMTVGMIAAAETLQASPPNELLESIAESITASRAMSKATLDLLLEIKETKASQPTEAIANAKPSVPAASIPSQSTVVTTPLPTQPFYGTPTVTVGPPTYTIGPPIVTTAPGNPQGYAFPQDVWDAIFSSGGNDCINGSCPVPQYQSPSPPRLFQGLRLNANQRAQR